LTAAILALALLAQPGKLADNIDRSPLPDPVAELARWKREGGRHSPRPAPAPAPIPLAELERAALTAWFADRIGLVPRRHRGR
jgi:hypothetical protein